MKTYTARCLFYSGEYGEEFEDVFTFRLGESLLHLLAFEAIREQFHNQLDAVLNARELNGSTYDYQLLSIIEIIHTEDTL